MLHVICIYSKCTWVVLIKDKKVRNIARYEVKKIGSFIIKQLKTIQKISMKIHNAKMKKNLLLH